MNKPKSRSDFRAIAKVGNVRIDNCTIYVYVNTLNSFTSEQSKLICFIKYLTYLRNACVQITQIVQLIDQCFNTNCVESTVIYTKLGFHLYTKKACLISILTLTS